MGINNNTKNHTRPPITMAFGGIALKSVSLFFRAIEFGCAAVIIGIFSYYLATLTDHSLPISVHIKAVEGISGQQCFTPSLLSSWSAASAALHSSLLWAWSPISHSVELSHTLPGLTDMPLMGHALDSSEPPTETDTPTWTTMSLEVMAVLPSCQA